MKLSAGTIGTVLITVAGIAVFVLMAKRTPSEGLDKSAMNFGMPMPSAVVEDKMPEATTTEAAPITIEAATTPMPETAATEAKAPEMLVTPEVEPAPKEETTEMPTTSETSMPAPTDTETKTEEVPAAMPTDAPAVDGSMPTN